MSDFHRSASIIWLLRSFLIAIFVVPAVYFATSYEYTASIVKTEAEINAMVISRMISVRPELWEYEFMRMHEYLEMRPSGHEETRRILNSRGKVVTESVSELPLPIITRSGILRDSGVAVGYLEISRSLRPLLLNSAWIAILIVPLYLGIYLLLRFLFLRSLQNAHDLAEQSDSRYRAIVEDTPMLLCRFLPDGTISFANKVFCSHSGKACEEVIGRSFHQFITEAERDSLWSQLASLTPDHPTMTCELHVPGAGGERKWQRWIVRAIFHEGKEVELQALGEDITDRKLEEEALKHAHESLSSIVEFLPDATFVIDTEGRVIAWNKAIEDMTQVPKASILGMGNHAHALPFYGKRRPILIDLVLEPQEELEKQHYPNIQKDGERIWSETYVPGTFGGRGAHLWGTASLIRNTAGKVVGAIESIRDMTEHKRAEEERRSWEKRLRQAQKAESLSRMAGAIAHHLNNLLGAVMGNLELSLYELPRESSAGPYLDEAMKASARAAEIGRFMLTYVGQIKGRLEPIDLALTVREALPLLATTLPERVAVQMELAPRGLPVLADTAQLKQVLATLIANASEAIGDKEGKITLAAHLMTDREIKEWSLLPLDWKPEAEASACLSVTDTGCGMDAVELERIFDPFYSTKFTGRGLGLPVALGLVRAHRGAMAVRSRPGSGSTFLVLLPLRKEDTVMPAPQAAPAREPVAARGLILLVDDEELVRSAGQAMLQLMGYDVLLARDGIEAMEIFRSRGDSIRLVLLDLSMPGMDGWQTLEALRKQRSDTVVVLTSGYDEAQVMRNHRPYLPQVFLKKPFRFADLQAALETALHPSNAGCIDKTVTDS